MQGDTFDQIAMAVYGSDKQVLILMQSNPDHVGTVVFPSGTMLIVPEIQREAMIPEGFPSWRKTQ